jgi:hypothetical protein
MRLFPFLKKGPHPIFLCVKAKTFLFFTVENNQKSSGMRCFQGLYIILRKTCAKLWKTFLLTKDKHRKKPEISSVSGFSAFPQDAVDYSL